MLFKNLHFWELPLQVEHARAPRGPWRIVDVARASDAHCPVLVHAVPYDLVQEDKRRLPVRGNIFLRKKKKKKEEKSIRAGKEEAERSEVEGGYHRLIYFL